jgi:excisionase family DNA binding protein
LREAKVWYSVKELADELGLKPSWVRDHATRKAPRLPAHKFGRLLKFRREEVEEFLEQIRIKPAA